VISLVGKLLKAMQRKARLALPYIATKGLLLVGDLGFGEVMPKPDQLKECAALLCASQGTSKACEVHHLIFSAAADVPKKEAFPVLHLVARDWINTYAPDRRWMAAFQDHNGKPHLHLLVQNVGDDGRPLKIKPHQVKELAAMSFTAHAVTAKGLGKARSLPVYPHAEKLTVRDVARDLAHVFDPREGLESLVQRHPDFSDFRRRTDGSVISFAYGKRRIRLSTLEGFLSDFITPTPTQTKGPVMPTQLTDPLQPVPVTLAEKLAALGVDPKKLERLTQAMQTPHQGPQPSAPSTEIDTDVEVN